MLSRIIALFTLLVLLMACKPAQPSSGTPTVQLAIPTPPLTAVNNASVLPILLPNEANKWVTYRDDATAFGLALPQQWRIAAPDPHAAQATLAVANYDTALTDNQCRWSHSLTQLTLTGWEIDSQQSTLDWIGASIVDVQSLEAVVNGRYAGYLLISDQQQLILRLTPDLILQIQVAHPTTWQHSDVQNILNSIAAPTETVELPAAPPTAPVAVPGFCQDVAPLYTGPGTHFEAVGFLLMHEPLPVIGRSHDGRWLKLLYPNAANNTAWVSLQDSIATAGEPPIEPIRVQPGNS